MDVLTKDLTLTPRINAAGLSVDSRCAANISFWLILGGSGSDAVVYAVLAGAT
jgi:hypothetical protein